MDARVDLAGVDCVLQRIDTAAALLEPVQKHQPDNALALARLAWVPDAAEPDGGGHAVLPAVHRAESRASAGVDGPGPAALEGG